LSIIIPDFYKTRTALPVTQPTLSKHHCQDLKALLPTKNKSSAVAEMGNRLATIDTGRKVGGSGGAVPLYMGRAGSPSNKMWPGSRPTSVLNGILIHPAIWPQQTWAENWGICPFFLGGELGPHLTQCGLGKTYLHTKWHPNPSNLLAIIHQHYRQTDNSLMA